MKELKLSNTTRVAIVDDDIFNHLSQYKWHVSNNTTIGRILPRKESGPKTVRISLAQEIMSNRNQMFDHIDRNFLNNQRSNLRPANNSLNAANKEKRAGTSSKYKGVRWHKNTGKWQAAIKIKGKEIYLGLHLTEESAALKYNEAASKYFGEFAVLNPV